MDLAACIVGKDVEDSEGRRPQPQGEPSLGGGLFLSHRLSAAQELRDLVFFAWFRFEANPRVRFLP